MRQCGILHFTNLASWWRKSWMLKRIQCHLLENEGFLFFWSLRLCWRTTCSEWGRSTLTCSTPVSRKGTLCFPFSYTLGHGNRHTDVHMHRVFSQTKLNNVTQFRWSHTKALIPWAYTEINHIDQSSILFLCFLCCHPIPHAVADYEQNWLKLARALL